LFGRREVFVWSSAQRRHRKRRSVTKIATGHGPRSDHRDEGDPPLQILANDTVALVERYQPVADNRVIDVGGLPGSFAKAFRDAGDECVLVDSLWDLLSGRGRTLGYGVLGDGMNLPSADCAFDAGHSFKVLEHVVKPRDYHRVYHCQMDQST
jgi:hypothetical protein